TVSDNGDGRTAQGRKGPRRGGGLARCGEEGQQEQHRAPTAQAGMHPAKVAAESHLLKPGFGKQGGRQAPGMLKVTGGIAGKTTGAAGNGAPARILLLLD